MKIYIPGLLNQPKSGKGHFFHRLALALPGHGIEVTPDNLEICDFSIHAARVNPSMSRCKILRFDGVWHNTKIDWERKNRSMSSMMCRVHAVVYQSHFAQCMCNKYLGVPMCPTRVIHNGADPEFYRSAEPARVDRDYVFTAFSRWRPHKRIKVIMDAFLLASIPKSILLIAGDLEKSGLTREDQIRYFTHSSIQYLGILTAKMMARYLKIATASLHFCWVDACPNSVVESIVAGVPVICNNTSGTLELVQESGGYICEVDDPYDMEPCDLYNPPKIDIKIVANNIVKATKKKISIKYKQLDIKNIAGEYAAYMKDLYSE